MCVEITILASGSRGNAILVHNSKEGVLIDCGLSLKETLKRLETAGIDPDVIKGICITHSHSDHVLGVVNLSKHLNIPVSVTKGTFDSSPWLDIPEERLRLFNRGESFAHNSFMIDSFKVSHDIGTPVGFTIKFNDHKIGIATDLGIADNDVINALKGCNVIILESNHDLSMLENSGRPEFLRNRISGIKGHLSNTQCAEALPKIINEDTSDVILCHLSRDCNTPELALESAMFALKDHEHIKITAAAQDKTCSVKLSDF